MIGSKRAATFWVLLLVVCHATALLAQPTKSRGRAPTPAITKPPAWTAEYSAMQSAEVYEKLGEFSKAEEQFLAAAKASDQKLRALALEGVKRANERARLVRDSDALALADAYERQQRWDRARDAYADVVKTATGPNLRRATDGMQRMQDRLRWEDRAARFDKLVLWLGRVAALGLVAWWIGRLIRSIRSTRRSIKVFSFVTQQDEAAKEILFWFAYVRAKWRSAAPAPGNVLMVSYSLPYVDLPGLPSDIPEIDDATLGETKLPLKELLNTWGRPRIRISGGWTSGATFGRAYGEIERRRFWHGYTVRGNVSRTIRQGASQPEDLELFSYDVLIRAAQAHAR